MWSWSVMIHPLLKRSRKPQYSWRWANHLALMAFQQKSISTGATQCSISSRISSQTVGRKGLYHRTSGMHCGHCLAVQKQGRKIRLFKLPRHHPTLHCRQNLGSRLAEQAHPNDSKGNTPESQRGFRSNRGMTDMILVQRQIQKKCRKQNMGLYTQLT